MVINVNERINNYLRNIQNNNKIIEKHIIVGNDNISNYLKQKNMDIKEFMYTTQSDNCILKAKTFADFEIFKLISPDSEVLSVFVNGEQVFKMVSVIGIPRYTRTCENIILEQEEKNTFKDTDIYFNDEFIMHNKVISNEKGRIIAETYSRNKNFGSDTDINKLLTEFAFSLDVIYTDQNTLGNIDIKYNNNILNKELLKNMNIDVISEQGKKDIWNQTAEQANLLITALNQIIMNNSKEKKY